MYSFIQVLQITYVSIVHGNWTAAETKTAGTAAWCYWFFDTHD